LDNGARVSANNHGATPVLNAVAGGHVDCLELLIQRDGLELDLNVPYMNAPWFEDGKHEPVTATHIAVYLCDVRAENNSQKLIKC
jgi:hypothetical protein